MPGTFWGMMTIIGPILLAIALGWALLHNRRTRSENAGTERATRELYDQADREDKAHSGPNG